LLAGAYAPGNEGVPYGHPLLCSETGLESFACNSRYLAQLVERLEFTELASRIVAGECTLDPGRLEVVELAKADFIEGLGNRFCLHVLVSPLYIRSVAIFRETRNGSNPILGAENRQQPLPSAARVHSRSATVRTSRVTMAPPQMT